jgi:2-dehydropantoate 2-reductase
MLWLGSKIVPFDLETYMKYHFTKVGEQTRVFLALWVTRCEAQGVQPQALKTLLEGLK